LSSWPRLFAVATTKFDLDEARILWESSNHESTRGVWPPLLCFLDAYGDPPCRLEIMLSLLERLYQQHEIDLVIYRNSHRNFYNRILHHVCIPIETAGFFILIGVVAPAMRPMLLTKKRNDVMIGDDGRILVFTASWTLGLLSLILSPDAVGVAALLFHVRTIPWLYDRCSPHHHNRHNHNHRTMMLLLLLTITTIASWIMQIGIGHWLLEQNQPTFLVQDSTSTLSMLTSIIIAWKS
jgi:hypothetical protein